MYEWQPITEPNSPFAGRLGSLGFKIAGGKDKPCVPGDPGIFIQRVKQGSPVHGILSTGDKILKVTRHLPLFQLLHDSWQRFCSWYFKFLLSYPRPTTTGVYLSPPIFPTGCLLLSAEAPRESKKEAGDGEESYLLCVHCPRLLSIPPWKLAWNLIGGEMTCETNWNLGSTTDNCVLWLDSHDVIGERDSEKVLRRGYHLLPWHTIFDTMFTQILTF